LAFAKAQRTGALAVDLTRTLQMLQCVLAQCAVMAELLDLEQPPIGRKADAAQHGIDPAVPPFVVLGAPELNRLRPQQHHSSLTRLMLDI